jgi:hypothetical protein
MFPVKTFPKPQPSCERKGWPRAVEENPLPTILETTGYTGGWVVLLTDAGDLRIFTRLDLIVTFLTSARPHFSFVPEKNQFTSIGEC